MNERGARDVVLLRAIETADAARAFWPDDERVRAGRMAAESVGEHASPDDFIARRAALGVAYVEGREPWVGKIRRAGRWIAWISTALVVLAFVAGVAGVDIGDSHRINLLAPPILGLLAWNLVVYALIALATLRKAGASGAATLELRPPAVDWFALLMRLTIQPSNSTPAGAAIARFAVDWPHAAASLWRSRGTRVLHTAAAALAAGAIAGLYLRGVVLEYRAGWESTFLRTEDVGRLLGVVLAPGSWLTGIGIPDATHLRSIGAGSGGENAAPWIHLYAATLAALIIAPRLLLALVAWSRERRLSREFQLQTSGLYFQRLTAAWRRRVVRVAAVAYSFAVPTQNAAGLVTLLTRSFESAVDIDWLPGVAYGEDHVPNFKASGVDAAVVVFNSTATPERDNHGAFIAALAMRARGVAAAATQLLVIVDTSEFARRFGADSSRAAEREAAWRDVLGARGVEPAFVRLDAPDLARAAAAIDRQLERSPP